MFYCVETLDRNVYGKQKYFKSYDIKKRQNSAFYPKFLHFFRIVNIEMISVI